MTRKEINKSYQFTKTDAMFWVSYLLEEKSWSDEFGLIYTVCQAYLTLLDEHDRLVEQNQILHALTCDKKPKGGFWGRTASRLIKRIRVLESQLTTCQATNKTSGQIIDIKLGQRYIQDGKESMLTEITETQEEYILCAAIHINDGKSYKGQPTNIKTGLVLTGHRHGNCFQLLEILDTMPPTRFDGAIEQGFLTSWNRFVNRKQAYTIARAQHQIISAHQPQRGHLLSEDLY